MKAATAFRDGNPFEKFLPYLFCAGLAKIGFTWAWEIYFLVLLKDTAFGVLFVGLEDIMRKPISL